MFLIAAVAAAVVIVVVLRVLRCSTPFPSNMKFKIQIFRILGTSPEITPPESPEQLPNLIFRTGASSERVVDGPDLAGAAARGGVRSDGDGIGPTA